MIFTGRDSEGAYIDVPDADVDLRLVDGKYVYRIHGDAITKLQRYEHLEFLYDLTKGKTDGARTEVEV